MSSRLVTLLGKVDSKYGSLDIKRSAIEAGFISPTHRNFLIFVDDPSHSYLLLASQTERPNTTSLPRLIGVERRCSRSSAGEKKVWEEPCPSTFPGTRTRTIGSSR